MSNLKTGIEWTDATWSPVTGCTKVSAGCKNCYAETVANRFWPTQYPAVPASPLPDQVANSLSIPEPLKRDLEQAVMRPRQFTDVQCHEDRLDQPLRWRKPKRVFVNSMSDLFHEDVPDAFIDRVFAVMALAYPHTFQILTKRADRMRAYLSAPDVGVRWLAAIYRHHGAEPATDDMAYQERDAERWASKGLDNVWLGVSAENQRFADERIPLILRTPAAVRFVSAEPLVEPMDLDRVTCRRCGQSFSNRPEPGRPERCPHCGTYDGDTIATLHQRWLHVVYRHRLDWVIVGGESGPKARPCDVDWIRSIVRQCQDAGVPVFVKQLGTKPVQRDAALPADAMLNLIFRKKDPKGGNPRYWPEDLNVRQYPEVRA